MSDFAHFLQAENVIGVIYKVPCDQALKYRTGTL